MGPSTRNKLLIGVGGLVGLMVAALLIAPAFIDLDGRKPEIAAEVKKATGRDLVIEGPVSLSLLPTPAVSVTGVKFFNMPGSKNPNMVEVKSITVRPSLFALLIGRLEVSSVTLVEPKIVLEVNAEGKPNWEFTPSVSEAKPVAATPAASQPVSIGEVIVKDGTLIFSNPKAGLSIVGEKANLSASVGSLDGPYSLSGGATINGSPITLDVSVGSRASDGYATKVALAGGGGKLAVKGNLSDLGPSGRFVGTATVSADSLSAFAGTLLSLSGQPAPPLPPLLAGKFSFDGGIDVSQTAIAAKDFKVMLGEDSGSGSLAVKLAPALSIDGKLSIPKLNIDTWLAGLAPATPAAPATASNTAAIALPRSPTASTSTPAPPAGSLLAALDARLAIDAGEIIYHRQAVRDVSLELDARGGAVAVPKLNATLPGDMVIQAKSTLSGDTARPTASGEFSLVAPKLRDTLNWLAVDVSALPPDRLKTLSLKGRMTSGNGDVQVPDATVELDDLKAAGGLVVSFGVPLSVTARIELGTFDLDAFLGTPAAGQKPAAVATSSSSAPAATAKVPGGPIFGLKAKVAKLIYKKRTISGVDADIGLQGNTLKLNDVKVSDFATARFAVRGAVVDYDTPAPQPDIAFNFEAADMSQTLKAVGETAPAGLGKVMASGGIAGTIESIQVKDFTVTAMNESARVNGVVSMPGATKGPPQSVGYRGSLTLNGQTIEGSVNAKLTGRPNITADLKTTLLDFDKLRAGAGAIAQPAVPVRGKPGTAAAQAPAQAIDTSALRSVDGSLKLVAASLVSSPLHLNNAEIDATLKDGVLTISKVKGGLYGGTLDLSGAIKTNQNAIAYDLKGDANNIYLGELLRGMSGTNMFGGKVKVTIDGKLNANSINLKGSGSTPAELKSSMNGGMQLGGYVYAGADKTLTTLGSAATGVVGGVLDNTLGTALGIVGQQNSGLNVGNMLNAVSLILNRFVNRNNALSGRVDIAGGILTDKGLMVQGDRATATIHTRTDLGKSLTDTTVDFRIAEDASAPYLITTARGPLASPSLGVSRGSAKDPPGFVNTLEKGASEVTQPAKSLIPNIPIPNIPNIFGR